MKKIIFWGDPTLTGPAGYAELLANHVFLHHPKAELSLAIIPASVPQGGDGATAGSSRGTLQEAFREAPLHAIGKDPDLLYLDFGYSDIQAGRPVSESARLLQDLVGLVLQKSHAHLALALVVSGFFPEGPRRDSAQALNRALRELAGARVSLVDLDGKVEEFLRLHRESPGDQQGLHLDSTRLTPLGQLLLAHNAYALAPWPAF